MKKALVSPDEQVKHVVGWNENPDPANIHKYIPVFDFIQNAGRIAQVETEESTFPVAQPYFWISCSDDIVADRFYFDLEAQEIKPIVNTPFPTISE